MLLLCLITLVRSLLLVGWALFMGHTELVVLLLLGVLSLLHISLVNTVQLLLHGILLGYLLLFFFLEYTFFAEVFLLGRNGCLFKLISYFRWRCNHLFELYLSWLLLLFLMLARIPLFTCCISSFWWLGTKYIFEILISIQWCFCKQWFWTLIVGFAAKLFVSVRRKVIFSVIFGERASMRSFLLNLRIVLLLFINFSLRTRSFLSDFGRQASFFVRLESLWCLYVRITELFNQRFF